MANNPFTFEFTVSESAVSGLLTERFGAEATNIQAAVFSGGTATFTFDRGYSRTSKQRVLTASFGDGYNQRVLDGINTKEDSFSVSFKNRPYEEVEVIAAYLDLTAVNGFTIKSGTEENIRIIPDGYQISYTYDSVFSLQSTFKRVYQP